MKVFIKQVLPLFLLLLAVILPFKKAISQVADTTAKEQPHLLTLYVIPPSKPMDWSSPRSLYKTALASYVSTLLKKQKKYMGHVFVKFSGPLLEEPFWGGMTRKNEKVQRRYVIKEKIGFSALGLPVEGRLENKEELLNYISYFQKRDELAFITFRVSENAAEKIIEFLDYFTTKFDDEHAPCDFYGGAFWPGYYFEGAGCTAFGLTLMETAQIKGEETSSWLRNVNIPNNLIGKPYNEKNKIRKKEIFDYKNWIPDEDTVNSFVRFSIYDPQLIYEWINQQRNLPENERFPAYSPFEEFEIDGLFTDRSNEKMTPDKPLVKPRPDSNIFISTYFENLKINIPDPDTNRTTPQHVFH